MLAAYAHAVNPEQPLEALTVGELDTPQAPPQWKRVQVRAATLNRHDLWALQGVALKSEQTPMVLGTDAAGLDDSGNRVLIHSVIGTPVDGDETLDPKRTLLSEQHPGTIAESVAAPADNLLAVPDGWSFAEAACLPTTYLTAWRMLTTRGNVTADSAVLVHGAGGGVSTATLQLARALGARVYVTSRSSERAERAAEAFGVVPAKVGERLPERVDTVIDSVGGSTVGYSLKSLRPGGRLVTCGATAGWNVELDMRQVFFRQLQILGSTMGTMEELREVMSFCSTREVRPVIDASYPLPEAAKGFERLSSTQAFGKIAILND
ncbi:zinc-binding dehydrogenase [Haloglycomyces albus]|uniref:zinc-binding dehydrogenase n=1 Tax=Haloglycomyces albus TaxID=526067 RepID=UPI00046CA29B|nr:quinone oxidoreductase [Haloglycomyces albus]